MGKARSKDLGIMDLSVEDVDDIGETIAKKLRSKGIESALQLATLTHEYLSELIVCSKDTATSYILNAQKLLRETKVLDKEFMTTREALESRKNVQRIDTGSNNLNKLLNGGIETQAMTEFYGEFGSGKTQICFTASVIATQPEDKGGLNAKAIYIDTEGTYRPDRIVEITKERGFDHDKILDDIILCKIYNSDHLQLVIDNLTEAIEKYEARLVVLDSAVALHRAEYLGRGTLADRQQKINNIVHRLVRIADMYNIAVIVTNQVMHDPNSMYGNPMRAVGGNVLGHTSTYRLQINKGSKTKRTVYMIDSPCHEYGGISIQLNKKGIDDTEE